MNRRKVKRLEIYMYDFGVTTGSIQNGSRPVIVIQDDRLNENSPTTVVAAITAVIKKEHLPSHIFIGRRFGLPKCDLRILLRSNDETCRLALVSIYSLREINRFAGRSGGRKIHLRVELGSTINSRPFNAGRLLNSKGSGRNLSMCRRWYGRYHKTPVRASRCRLQYNASGILQT